MRISMAEITGRRGAGLGNELNGWAKAYIASRVLNARPIGPAWGLNPRGYRSYFGTSRLDWMYQAGMRSLLPAFRMTAADFGESYGKDFRAIVTDFAERNGLFERRTYVFVVGGMWGGKGMLREAYPYIRSQLLSAKSTVANLGDLERRLPPDVLRIALHVRRGDFLSPSEVSQQTAGPWNTALPLSWYIALCRSLTRQLSAPHKFLLFSDGAPHEIEPLISAIQPVTTTHQKMNVCSDLLAMADADLLLTSCSSFSLWAAALSKSPYIWHVKNLVLRDSGLAMWDHGLPLSNRMAENPRGVAVGDDGEVDRSLIAYLDAVHSRRGWGNDLVFYGKVSP